MPELPEVETVRRLLEGSIVGLTIRTASLSGKKLSEPIPRSLPSQVRGRRITTLRRHGKYLLIDLDQDLTLLSHLGMSGRWLFHAEQPQRAMPHVHAKIAFTDGSELWFQDPRRFGLLRAVRSSRLVTDPRLAGLGPDPVLHPPTGAALHALASGMSVAIKGFLLDQRRIAGIGNIYASEILHRAGVDPRTPAGSVPADRWEAIARHILGVLNAAILRSGTTFSMYRTIWNEPGAYGDQLLVYDRSGQPCAKCRTPIRRIVQGARSTFYCPRCQPPRPLKKARKRAVPKAKRVSGSGPRKISTLAIVSRRRTP
ncbi:MAG TPA: bifunctional DNA-formamidopyrimidine glycosylase/DNA-(apurinic or apyrimidinic site) lyase [Candidatus Eisenbacteria bacterium]|nr:bifunctional DNA-formamidopyrimidine glycosylase/DNA-(apurinic or apyrimidinic site) lyase [Candidatus Eisenbacteria bacterium]